LSKEYRHQIKGFLLVKSITRVKINYSEGL
jgi:hypothetical protein